MMGLLSKPNEDLTITRKSADGSTVTIKSPSGSSMDIGGLLGGAVQQPQQQRHPMAMNTMSGMSRMNQGGMPYIPHMNQGGYSNWHRMNQGGSPVADDIPTMLTEGEFVMNVPATQKYKPVLERMNQEGREMLAQGGWIAEPKPMGYFAGGGVTGGYGEYTQADYLKEAGIDTGKIGVNLTKEQLENIIAAGSPEQAAAAQKQLDALLAAELTSGEVVTDATADIATLDYSSMSMDDPRLVAGYDAKIPAAIQRVDQLFTQLEKNDKVELLKFQKIFTEDGSQGDRLLEEQIEKAGTDDFQFSTTQLKGEQYPETVVLDPLSTDPADFDKMNKLVTDGIYGIEQDRAGRAIYKLSDLGNSHNVRAVGSGVRNTGVDTSNIKPRDSYGYEPLQARQLFSSGRGDALEAPGAREDVFKYGQVSQPPTINPDGSKIQYKAGQQYTVANKQQGEQFVAQGIVEVGAIFITLDTSTKGVAQ